MKNSEILFVAGNVERLASIKIRCREISMRLGCDAIYNVKSVKDVPRGYKVYVCVKPDFPRCELSDLEGYGGVVVWDILDDNPPLEGVSCYIASTGFAKSKFSNLVRQIEVINHYHCNFRGELSDGLSRVPAYVGSVHWYPNFGNIKHEVHMVDRIGREELDVIYRGVGIGLNLRSLRVDGEKWTTDKHDITPNSVKHIALNSGIKLINCMGYGIPSLSSVEPAYLELAPECTIFTDQLDCSDHLDELQNDDGLYNRLRMKCISESKRFDVSEIVAHYRKLFSSF